MEAIKDQIQGISTGFNTDTARLWTKEEQKDAVTRNNANDFYKEVFNQVR